jgi:hypothetical protein
MCQVAFLSHSTKCLVKGRVENVIPTARGVYEVNLKKADGSSDLLFLNDHCIRSLEYHEGHLVGRKIEFDPTRYTIKFADSRRTYKSILRLDDDGEIISGAELL